MDTPAVIEFCVEKHGKLKSNSFGRGDWDKLFFLVFIVCWFGSDSKNGSFYAKSTVSILRNKMLIC